MPSPRPRRRTPKGRFGSSLPPPPPYSGEQFTPESFSGAKITSASAFYHPLFEGMPEHTHLWFDSISDFVEYGHKTHTNYGNIQNSEANSPSKEWDLYLGYQGSVDLSRIGWAEGAQKVDDLADKVDQIVRQKLPNQRLAVRPVMVGGRVSVPAYLSGHPKQYLSLKREPATCKTITINLNNCVSASVDANTFMLRGIAVAALVRVLERKRVKCEVVTTMSTKTSVPGGRVCAAVVVKKAADKLMPDSIAFALAHPACFRRNGFATFEGQAAACRGDLGWGYGMPTPVHIPGAVNIDTMPCYSDDQMQTYVEEQLKLILEMP